jgi:class 3 adenylate cyclase/tetratricopeptide (TPR) repeat protein
MSRGVLEGERKQVTVLFADIKSSLELVAESDPEDARALLDPVLELMIQAVHRYEGTVNQVMGDGIMALFGAPLAHEDHALRACCAALRIQHDVESHSEERVRNQRVRTPVRIGINSGEVVVRSIGSDLDMDYTAVGQTTHLAGRLEQMATPGTILCGPATQRLAEGFLRCRSLGPVAIRGLAQPVEIAELVGIETARTRFHAAVARGLGPLVGRREECQAIDEALERAAGGSGQIVLVVGDAGVGKSRLCWEVSRSALVRDWLRLEGGGVSYGETVPYAPLAFLFRTYCDIDDRDDARQAQDKAVARLARVHAIGPWTLPAFLGLLGLPSDDPSWAALDPPRRRDYTTQAIVAWLLHESQGRPLLLLLEDLHWVDQGTQAVVDAIVEQLGAARMVLLGNCRPEYARRWEGRGAITVLNLGPLPRVSAAQMLRGLLGDDPSLDELTAMLIERTGGNPLFLEESVRTLVETGALVKHASGYRLTRSLDRVDVPLSVRAILAARIDRLDPDDKQILQAAAVVGDEVPLPLLRAAAEEFGEDLDAELTRLREASFLYEAALYPEPTYAFSHTLMREVAYSGLVHDRRRLLHGRVVAGMESFYGGRIAEHIERLAQHAVGADDWPKAVRYLRQAGAKAASRSAYREAVAHYEQALMAVDRLPSTLEARAAAIDLRFELRNALYPLGRVQRDRDHLLAVMPVAEAMGDEHRLGWLLAYLARDTSLLGDPGRALELGRRALTIAERVGERRLQTVVTAYLGAAHYARGEYREAIGLLDESVRALGTGPPHDPLGLPGPAGVFFRVWLVSSAARVGDFADGRRRALEALDIAGSADQPLSLAVAHYSVGLLALAQGRTPDAIVALEQSLDLCRRWNLYAWFPNIASHLGLGYARSGRLDDGIELLQQATARMSSAFDASSECAMLAQALLLAGRGTEARDQAEYARALAQNYQERGNEAVALWVLGEAEAGAAPDGLGQCLDHYQAALRLATELEMRPLVAGCHAGLGRVWSAAGQPAAAEALATAEHLYRELGIQRE